MSLLTVTSTGALLLLASCTSVSSKLRDRHKYRKKEKIMVELQLQDWSPNDRESPFHIWYMLTSEEWLRISRQYPFSIRALIKLPDETRWSERARTQTEEQAKDLMQELARLHSNKDWWVGWVVMESTCLGQETREKPIHWYPTQKRVLELLRQDGLLKTS